MQRTTKIQIAGVGGQGVVFLTNLIVEAALLADIPVATSEIHGLSQRGGSVTAGITLGEHGNGFIEKAGADYLFGLEVLEAQRCTDYLHKDTAAFIVDTQIVPYSVHAGTHTYPDKKKFIRFLEKNIRQVVLIENVAGIRDILRNVHLLGVASVTENFPLSDAYITAAIHAQVSKHNLADTLHAYEAGKNYLQQKILT